MKTKGNKRKQKNWCSNDEKDIVNTTVCYITHTHAEKSTQAESKNNFITTMKQASESNEYCISMCVDVGRMLCCI